MILADTSLWVDHLGNGDEQMQALLDRREIVTHPFVIGEISLGSLRHRQRVMGNLHALPQVIVAQSDELPDFIERHELFGTGIGYVDAHLLAATMLTPDTRLWTRDKQLCRAAVRFGVAFSPTH